MLRSFGAKSFGSKSFGSKSIGLKSFGSKPFRSQAGKIAPSRIVTLTSGQSATSEGTAQLARQRFRPTRALPANLALINQGLRNKPAGRKPTHVVHNPYRKAGKSGWKHGYKPFYYQHKGKHWRRHYYPVFVGGLWYWYWYDSVYDGEPVVYEEVVLPECDPDSDDCTEPQLIAPAIVDGRATQEALDRCAAKYKSFKPETGTYLASPGTTRVCPYLL